MSVVLKKGSRTTTLDATQMSNPELLRAYFADGWSIESGGDTTLDNQYVPETQQLHSSTFSDFYERAGRGQATPVLQGRDLWNARVAQSEQELARQREAEASGALGMALSASEGVVSMLPGGQALTQGLRGALYEDNLGNEITQEAVAANPVSYGVGATGMFLTQYLATGGASSGMGTLGRVSSALAGGVGGVARRAGGIASRLSAARLGTNSALAGAAQWMSAAVAEDVTASVAIDLNDILAGKQEFIAENILANAGQSALLGLGIEGGIRGIGAAARSLTGAARHAYGALRGADDVSLSTLDTPELRQSISQAAGPDAEYLIRETFENARAGSAEDSYALAIQNAPEAMRATEELHGIASRAGNQLQEAVQELNTVLSAEAKGSNLRNALRETDIRNAQLKDVKPQTLSDLTAVIARARDEVLQGSGEKAFTQLKGIVRRGQEAVQKANSPVRVFEALTEAQDAAADVMRKHFGNIYDSAQVPPSVAALKGQLDELVYHPRWGNTAEWRQSQQLSLGELRQGIDNLKEVSLGARGKKVNLENVQVKAEKLNTLFNKLSSTNISQNFDDLVVGVHRLKSAAEALPQGAPIAAKLQNVVDELVSAHKYAALKAAVNDLRSQSAKITQDLSTFRSAKGILGGGPILGAAVGGAPGFAISMGAAALVKPYNRLRIKAWLENALQDNLGKFSTGLKRVSSAMKSGRATAVRASMTKSEQRARYEEEWERTQQMQMNPYDVADFVGESTAGFADEAWSLVNPVQNQMLAKQMYITQVIPQPLVDQLRPTKILAYPNNSEMLDFMRRLEVLDDPFRLLDRLADGSITAGAVEAVRVVYPDLYADMLASVAELTYVQEQRIPKQMRTNLYLSFGIVSDGSLLPSFTMAMQQSAAQTPEQDAVMNGARPISTRKMGLSQTLTERIAD